MLPRWHILLGAIFTAVLFALAPNLPKIHFILVFFSSFLIDFDHYLTHGIKTGTWHLGKSIENHKKMLIKQKQEAAKGIRKRGDFHLFHTVEFHILVGLFGFLWIGFFFVFIGMIFHSLLDLVSISYNGIFHVREYFLTNWLRKRIK